VTLLINNELVSRAKCLVTVFLVFPHIVKNCPKMRNLPKIFLRSVKNVGPGNPMSLSGQQELHQVKPGEWIVDVGESPA